MDSSQRLPRSISARLATFVTPVENLWGYDPETGAYEAAISNCAEQLATRLRQPVVLDNDAFAHLTFESPWHARDSAEARTVMRKYSIQSHESVITTSYAPRASFGITRNRNGLVIDMEIVRNPLGRTLDMPGQRKIGEDVIIVPVDGLATRQTLRPLGVGKDHGVYKVLWT